MKLKDLLSEGTWAAPHSVEKAQKLAELMKEPIPAQRAADILYDLIGDDDLFDNILDIERDDPNEDVRPTIAMKLEKWLKEGKATGFANWRYQWDPEALTILDRLVRQFA